MKATLLAEYLSMFARRLFSLALLLVIPCVALIGIRLTQAAVTPSLEPALSPVSAELPYSAAEKPWQLYAFQDGTFHSLNSSRLIPDRSVTPQTPDQSLVPPTWHVSASALADVTGDGRPEWVLIVWRPWRDWPIQRWSSARSPITDFHDKAGNSCHLILLDPDDGHEIWAGSALPAPLLALAVGDVDGDNLSEVVTLEGDYATGQQGPATHVDVWGWNGFGFTLKWRSPAGTYHQLNLMDADDDHVLDIAVR